MVVFVVVVVVVLQYRKRMMKHALSGAELIPFCN